MLASHDRLLLSALKVRTHLRHEGQKTQSESADLCLDDARHRREEKQASSSSKRGLLLVFRDLDRRCSDVRLPMVFSAFDGFIHGHLIGIEKGFA